MAEMTAEHTPKPFAKTLKGRLSAVVLGIAAGLGVGSQIPPIGGQESHNSPPAAGSPTPTGTPENTLTIPPRSTETATPTPETQKFVYWTKEQIESAQKTALDQNRILYLDTWSSKGGSVQDAKTYNDRDVLVIDGLSAGDVFNSPIKGVVEDVSTLKGRGFLAQIIDIKVGKITISIYLNNNDDVLVKENQQIDVDTPLCNSNGEKLPKLGFSKIGQIAIANADQTIVSPASTANILKDNNGLIVQLR